MYHYMEFDPYLIRECKEGILREVSTFRLQKQLRENRRPHTARLSSLRHRGALLILPLLRKVELAA